MKKFPFIHDEEIQKLADKEARRQADGLEMIPSENHTSQAVLDAVAAVDHVIRIRLINKA